MKLSEAIRLNGMVKQQGYGNESMYSADAPCALGGALQAIGKQMTGNEYALGENYRRITEEWPWLYNSYPHCPACLEARGYFADVIWHLNDYHLWTRQQIADWVATVEPLESLPVAPLDVEMPEEKPAGHSYDDKSQNVVLR